MGPIPRDILERLSFFHDEVERLFRRLFEEEPGAGPPGEEGSFPPVDVLEAQTEIIVRADLPGTERENIELHGAPNFLVIRGTKPPTRQEGACLRLERTFGSFQRLVVLPDSGDPARVRARYEKGVLEVRVPKVADRRKIHRLIPIE